MQLIRRTLLLALLGAALSVPAMAGECCKNAMAMAKEGKTCAKCQDKLCCKNAIKKIKADAKPCEVCAAKKKK
jgi:hypothetical protein